MDFLNHMLKKHKAPIIGILSVIVILAIYISSISRAAFAPGAELDPNCEPGDVGCVVTFPAGGLGEENVGSGNLSVGTDTGDVDSGADGNVFLGVGAGKDTTVSGVHNVGIGQNALFTNTDGYANIAIGVNTLTLNTTGGRNIAIGDQTMLQNTLGEINLAIGGAALQNNTTAGQNVAVGEQALQNQSYDNSGFPWVSDNVAIGYQALYSNQPATTADGIQNTAVGNYTLHDNTTGYQNAALGFEALFSNTTGYANIASGYQALRTNTSGFSNIASGFAALFSNTTGQENIAVGHNALYNNDTGNSNTAVGSVALFSNTTGLNNSAFGAGTLFSSNGDDNTAIGYQALNANTSANANTAVGYQSLLSNISGGSNTAIGHGSLLTSSAGSFNTALGSNSLYSNDIGSYNVSLGYEAGYSAMGDGNVFIGYQAGKTDGINANELWIDNEDNATPLIFGDFAGDALTINGDLTITGTCTGCGGGSWQEATFTTDPGGVNDFTIIDENTKDTSVVMLSISAKNSSGSKTYMRYYHRLFDSAGTDLTVNDTLNTLQNNTDASLTIMYSTTGPDDLSFTIQANGDSSDIMDWSVAYQVITQ